MPNLVEVPESQFTNKLVLSKWWQYQHGNYFICHIFMEKLKVMAI
jgi:hypothetical protein